MAKEHPARLAASVLAEIPQAAELCRQIALSLIETGQSWLRATWFIAMVIPTDYERARRTMIHNCGMALRDLRSVRRASLSVDAIHATANVRKVLECCRQCPEANRKNVEQGQGFECLVQQRLGQPSGDGFRFRLDEEGQILEQQ